MHQQPLYECIHNFINKGRWISVEGDQTASGMTWLELFILFGTQGWRDEHAHMKLSTEAEQRARARIAKSRERWKRPRVGKTYTSMTKPCLSKELANFKAIARHIIANDAKDERRNLFRQNVGHIAWRLREFGIIGQQPAVNAVSYHQDGTGAP